VRKGATEGRDIAKETGGKKKNKAANSYRGLRGRQGGTEQEREIERRGETDGETVGKRQGGQM
jgi:hypothetical protein